VKIVERFERAGSAQVVEDPIPDSGNRVGSGRSGRINDAESTAVTSTLIVQSRPAEMEDWEATDDMEIADCAGSSSVKLQTVTLPVIAFMKKIMGIAPPSPGHFRRWVSWV
jgi:hypothetical protein